MDYCTYGHMIDNVVLIVTGTLHERDVQVPQALQNMPSLARLTDACMPACRQALPAFSAHEAHLHNS